MFSMQAEKKQYARPLWKQRGLRLSKNLPGYKYRGEGQCEREPSGFPFAFNHPPPMLCFVGTDDLSSSLCAPYPTGGSTHLPCRAGSMYPAVLILSFRVCRGGRLCPPAHTGVGIRLSKKGSGLPRRCAPRNDRLFRQSQRRGLAPPLLFCRSGQQKMQFMQEHPA